VVDDQSFNVYKNYVFLDVLRPILNTLFRNHKADGKYSYG